MPRPPAYDQGLRDNAYKEGKCVCTLDVDTPKGKAVAGRSYRTTIQFAVTVEQGKQLEELALKFFNENEAQRKGTPT